MKNKIHTIIFDLDGTLSDSGILTSSALKTIAPEYGFPVPTEEEIRKATGYANPEFYCILFPDRPRDKVFEMGHAVELLELRILPTLSDQLLFKGCRELLDYLKKRGIVLCIASTGDREHVFSILKATGIVGFFDTITCERPDKTEMLCDIIKDKDKHGCVMVGDMKKDSDSARANGILSVGACYGYCQKEFSSFDFYIDSPLELLSLLGI